MVHLLDWIKKPLIAQMEILSPCVRLPNLSAEVWNSGQADKELCCLCWDWLQPRSQTILEHKSDIAVGLVWKAFAGLYLILMMIYFNWLSKTCFKWVQCTSLYVLVILFLVLKVLCVSLFGKIVQPFEGHIFCAAFKISRVCWVFAWGYPLRFTGQFVFVLTVTLSHFLSKSSPFWPWVIGGEDEEVLGARVWNAALQRACLDSFLSLCVDSVIERAVRALWWWKWIKWLNVLIIQMCNVPSACTSLGVLVYYLIFGDKTLLVLALHSAGASSAHLLIFKLDIDISLPHLWAVLHCRHRSQRSYLQYSGWFMAPWQAGGCLPVCYSAHAVGIVSSWVTLTQQ